MPRSVSKKNLLAQLKTSFPDRWKVARLDIRGDGDGVKGAIKIHCLEDDKVFLSDFSAVLDGNGRITELELDGVSVGKFIGKLHHGR